MHNSSASYPEPSIQTTPENTESITNAVVSAVAEAKGTKPATPLYEAIDPDALDDLYQHSSPEVSFEYVGFRVTIHSDRTITVADLRK
ncbi:HalOD1 output domain-containing protein [Haladaptatus sp. DFWS20]|uniref:HalOD1 output domain-containing protein n=1 Tax=Haladaptatus sp. DFWS20 TaxID=3403467 RepID=UPI003EBC4CF3